MNYEEEARKKKAGKPLNKTEWDQDKTLNIEQKE
jgi:hypothetical protein